MMGLIGCEKARFLDARDAMIPGDARLCLYNAGSKRSYRRRFGVEKGLVVRKLKIVIILVVVVVVLGAGGLTLMKRRAKKTQKPTTVRIESPARGTLVEYVTAPGEIEPKSNVEISAKVSARIDALPYEEGQTVTKGDPNANPPVPASVLVRVDSKDWESQLLSAQASRDAQAAQIEVEQARIASQKETLTGLKASLEQAQQKYDLEESLKYCKEVLGLGLKK